MASQNLGTLTVELNAESKKFLSGMASAAAGVEKFAKETKKLANDVAQVSGALLAIGGAAVAMAAQVDTVAAKAVDELKKSAQLLAVQVTDLLLPAMKQLGEWFKAAANFVAGLDPELKKQISTWAVYIAGIAVASKAIAVVAGLVSGLAGAFSAALGALAAIGAGPIIAILAVAAAVAALHYAFRKNLGGIADMWKTLTEWLSSTWNNVAASWVDAIDTWVKAAVRGVANVVRAWAELEKLRGNTEKAFGLQFMAQGLDTLAKNITGGAVFKDIVTAAWDAGRQAGQGFVDEWKRIMSELGVDDIMSKIKGISSNSGARKPIGPAGPDAQPTVNTSSMEVLSFIGAMNASAAEGAGSMDALAVHMQVSMNDAATAENYANRQAEHAKAAAEASAKMKQKVNAMVMSMIQSTAGVLGAVGNLVNVAISAGSTGGPWAAFVAVIMEIVKETASAMEFVGVAMNFVKEIAKMIEPLVKPIFDALTNVLGQIMEAIGPLFVSLQPLMDGVARLIGNLAPIFAAIGDVVTALGPLIEWIGKAVGAVFDALKPIFELIAGVVKVIATVIMGIIIFLNAIAAALGDEKAAAEVERMKQMVADMWDPNREARDRADQEAATATIRNATAQDKAAAAATRLAESLTNVPSGYKMALARYNATQEQNYAGVGSMPGTSGSSGGGGGTTTIINVAGDVKVDNSAAQNSGDLAADIKRAATIERGQRSGNSTRID